MKTIINENGDFKGCEMVYFGVYVLKEEALEGIRSSPSRAGEAPTKKKKRATKILGFFFMKRARLG